MCNYFDIKEERLQRTGKVEPKPGVESALDPEALKVNGEEMH